MGTDVQSWYRVYPTLHSHHRPPTLEETICRHLHRLEWRAPVPRREPCAQCVGLGFVVRRAHGGVG